MPFFRPPTVNPTTQTPGSTPRRRSIKDSTLTHAVTANSSDNDHRIVEAGLKKDGGHALSHGGGMHGGYQNGVARAADGIPDKDVVDGWFDEIMSSLVPTTPTRAPTLPTHLTTESKWDLVRAYRAKSSPDLFSKSKCSLSPIHHASSLSPHTPLPVSRSQSHSSITSTAGSDCSGWMECKPETPQAWVAFLARVVSECLEEVVVGRRVVEAVRELRVCVWCELPRWCETFLEADGLQCMSNLMAHLAGKPRKHPLDWALHLELLRILQGLLKLPLTFTYLTRTPTIICHLNKTLFGWWRAHHHHADHYTRCVAGGESGILLQVGSLAAPTASSNTSASPSSASQPAPVADAQTPGRRFSVTRRKQPFQPTSDTPEPTPYSPSAHAPPLADRTLGLQLLTTAIEGGAWDACMRALDTVAGLSEGDIEFRSPSRFMVVPNTLRPWTVTLQRVVLERAARWTGAYTRRKEIYEKLKRSSGAAAKGFSSPARTVSAKTGEEVHGSDVGVVVFLEANVRFMVGMIRYAPPSERSWIRGMLFEKAGMNDIVAKMKLCPDPSFLTLLDTNLAQISRLCTPFSTHIPATVPRAAPEDIIEPAPTHGAVDPRLFGFLQHHRQHRVASDSTHNQDQTQPRQIHAPPSDPTPPAAATEPVMPRHDSGHVGHIARTLHRSPGHRDIASILTGHPTNTASAYNPPNPIRHVNEVAVNPSTARRWGSAILRGDWTGLGRASSSGAGVGTATAGEASPAQVVEDASLDVSAVDSDGDDLSEGEWNFGMGAPREGDGGSEGGSEDGGRRMGV
ncbi:uncharacterized protein EV422DRAFT_576361 [Fimicolochytrium jonesii]|uniref:uncharacterized protein n=1 Tax=Fimicolochytrium jonesii TaxID=1396493 RepID=UPI0022FE6B4A|nr:uncharacterized protein EV422DRAFT_576361 [Fimicolochytrium jonesii]KAI8825174.1 hypothetical protein EV422DRAFT_576361 [Fimicolochytrium jonesii]